MPSILNATTTNGLVTSADNSGSLQLQTNSGTTAVTIDTSQNVGIGTSSPNTRVQSTVGSNGSGVVNALRLQNVGTSVGDGAKILFTAGTSTNGAGISSTGVALDSADLRFETGGSNERMRIDSSGNLLVGTTTTSSYGAGIGKLYLAANGANWQVGPTSAFANFYIKANTGFGVGMSPTATSWSSDSDERLKTELTPFENPLEKVCSLRAGTGRYLIDEENISRSFLIAQDVQKVLPEAIDVGTDENKTLQLRYTEVIPLLVSAIQELKAELNEVKAELDATKAEVQALKGVA